MPSRGSPKVTLRLSPRDLEELDRLASKLKVDRSELIRKAIRLLLEGSSGAGSPVLQGVGHVGRGGADVQAEVAYLRGRVEALERTLDRLMELALSLQAQAPFPASQTPPGRIRRGVRHPSELAGRVERSRVEVIRRWEDDLSGHSAELPPNLGAELFLKEFVEDNPWADVLSRKALEEGEFSWVPAVG